MLYNMKLNFQKLLDIKCILAEVSKKQLASDLGISQMTLSREIKDQKIISLIEGYFDKIDMEINTSCDKLREYVANKTTDINSQLTNSNKTIMDRPNEIEIRNKIIALQEQLLKHKEERILILEKEKERIIKEYGNIYNGDNKK